MSLATLTGTHSLSIERLFLTQDKTGGQVREYAAAARGTLPTEADCGAFRMKPRERVEHGVRAERAGWKFLLTEDPQISLDDRVIFTDSGEEHTVKVLTSSHKLYVPDASALAIWRFFGEEDTTERIDEQRN